MINTDASATASVFVRSAKTQRINTTRRKKMIVDWESESERMVYPAGTYKVVIDSFERVTASTGTEQVRWFAKIVEPLEHKDRTIVDHTAITEKALWRLIKFVSATGVDVKSLGKMDTSSPSFDSVLAKTKGRTMFWRVEEGRDKNNLPRNEIVDFVNDLDQPEISADEDAAPKVLWDEEKSPA